MYEFFITELAFPLYQGVTGVLFPSLSMPFLFCSAFYPMDFLAILILGSHQSVFPDDDKYKYFDIKQY